LERSSQPADLILRLRQGSGIRSAPGTKLGECDYRTTQPKTGTNKFDKIHCASNEFLCIGPRLVDKDQVCEEGACVGLSWISGIHEGSRNASL